MGASAMVHFSYPLQMARNLNHQDPGGRGHGSCIPDSYMVSFKGVNVDFAYYTIHSTRVHTCERGAPARHVVRYMGTSRARVRRQRSTPSSSRPTPCTPCAQCNGPLAPHPPAVADDVCVVAVRADADNQTQTKACHAHACSRRGALPPSSFFMCASPLPHACSPQGLLLDARARASPPRLSRCRRLGTQRVLRAVLWFPARRLFAWAAHTINEMMAWKPDDPG